MSEQEQNKRINQLRRQLANAAERIKTLELYQLEKYLLQIRSPQPPLLRGARGDR
jgi:hypothetical protein